MSDERGKKLLRSAKTGDPQSAARAVVHGVRSADSDLVVQAVEAAVGSLDTDVLDTILYVIGRELASREINIKAGRETYKAGELHGPDLGQVSLGRFVHEVVDFVEKLKIGDSAASKLMRDNTREHYWNRNREIITKDKQIESAKKTLEKAEGIMIATSAAIRIYALKPADLDKARKKLDKRQKEIEAKIAKMERAKKNTERQLQEFEAQKARMEKERAAALKKLAKEKEKIKRDKVALEERAP